MILLTILGLICGGVFIFATIVSILAWCFVLISLLDRKWVDMGLALIVLILASFVWVGYLYSRNTISSEYTWKLDIKYNIKKYVGISSMAFPVVPTYVFLDNSGKTICVPSAHTKNSDGTVVTMGSNLGVVRYVKKYTGNKYAVKFFFFDLLANYYRYEITLQD